MKRAWLLLGATAWLAGCGTNISFLQTHTPPRPLAPRAFMSVELLTAGPPQRPYVEVGMLEAQQESPYSTDSQQGVLYKMRERAAEIGCDALVVTGDNNASAYYPAGNGVVGATTLKGYRGTCIVYTTPTPTPGAPAAAPGTAPPAAPPAPAAPLPAPPPAAPPPPH